MRSERGFTLVELLVAMTMGVVVLLALLSLVDVSTRGTARVANRVDADQRGRSVLQHLFDELHSACVAPGAPPIVAGSSGTSLSLVEQTGSAVTPTPDKHVVSLVNGVLSESVYPATGGAAPAWTFAVAPSSVRQLLAGIGPASGNPPTFQYFTYVGGQLSSTPLPVPLNAADAARTASVTISFSVSPTTTSAPDSNAAVSVSDSAVLRVSPALEDTSQGNPPCT